MFLQEFSQFCFHYYIKDMKKLKKLLINIQ